MFVKKPLGVGLVIGLLALAFAALPAFASASVTLKANGEALKAGTEVSGTSSNVITETEGGFGPTLECSSVSIHGEVVANESEPAELGNGGGSATGCHAGAATVLINSITIPFTRFSAGGVDEAEQTFVYEIVSSENPAEWPQCQFTGVVGTSWTTTSNVDTINPSALTGSTLRAGNTPCPANGEISGSFPLEAEGSPLEIE